MLPGWIRKGRGGGGGEGEAGGGGSVGDDDGRGGGGVEGGGAHAQLQRGRQTVVRPVLPWRTACGIFSVHTNTSEMFSCCDQVCCTLV